MGEVFAGRYELVDPIGRGGVGAVWRAWDHRRRRYVAAKVLLQSDAHSLLRFVREQALRIDHPHVLAPTSWAADDDKVLFTMDLVAGGSLVHLVGDYGPLPPAFVCTLLDQLLAGLAAVHAEGVVHRDVKPANVLLEATGTGRPRLRLSDFGIAMRLGEPRLTETNLVVGTPGYLAPEQLMGAEPDFPADLFAVGLVALYLLEGAKPDSKALIQYFAEHGTPGAPKGIPEPLWQVVAGLLQPDPEARFRSATGARKALAAAAELLPEPGPDDELIEIFDQLGPLPPGFALEGPLRRARGLGPAEAPTGRAEPDGEAPGRGPGPDDETPGSPTASGSTGGPPAAPATDSTTGQRPRPQAAPAPGAPTDPATSRNRGLPTDPASGQNPGLATGPASGHDPRRPTDPATGGSVALPTGPAAGDSPGPSTGPASGDSPGLPTGPAPGHSSGPSTASATDHSSRPPSEHATDHSSPRPAVPAAAAAAAAADGTSEPSDPAQPAGHRPSLAPADPSNPGAPAQHSGLSDPSHASHPPSTAWPTATGEPSPSQGQFAATGEAAAPAPQPSQSSMSDTGSFPLPPPQGTVTSSPRPHAEALPPQRPVSPHDPTLPLPPAQPFPPTYTAQPLPPAQHYRADPVTASYTAQSPQTAPPAGQLPARHRARRAARPGPPAKAVVPLLILALACYAVGFWALAQL
ncbi:protein kinase [Streptomyces sp. NPDC057382]|uniref:protein kinase domain-containing protein n=1 Tax=unclassified Streptomyces TaxID=2593676 RepID=UPI003634332B